MVQTAEEIEGQLEIKIKEMEDFQTNSHYV
jgi:hypothetical protein